MREVFDNMKIYDFANLDSIEIENGISFCDYDVCDGCDDVCDGGW